MCNNRTVVLTNNYIVLNIYQNKTFPTLSDTNHVPLTVLL